MSNLLDHVHDPAIVVDEVRRGWRPAGYFYLFVDVFSVAGPLQWKGCTATEMQGGNPSARASPSISRVYCNARDCVLSGKICGRFGVDCLRAARVFAILAQKG